MSRVLCDARIKQGIGFGVCDLFVSGAAPLAGTVRELFAALNMPVTDAYGLSQTTGSICASRRNKFVPDAVGPAVMGGELMIEHKDGPDQGTRGEICYRGRSAMMDKTRRTFDGETFLHTGDVGYIDGYDCLHITGRIKELLVTAAERTSRRCPWRTT